MLSQIPIDWSAITSLGSAASALIVTFWFLRFLHQERTDRAAVETVRLAALKDIGKCCHDHNEKLTVQYEAGQEKLGLLVNETNQLMGRMMQRLDEMDSL